MEDLRKAVVELLKTAPGHIKGHWSELDEVVKALAQPEQEPVAWQTFNEWMHEELPAGTIIGDTGWWASHIYKKFLRIAPPSNPEQEPVGNEVQLNIIRWWPDGFAKRLDHVWKDLVGFIPNYKLHDLQLLLAEYGFTMKVYEGEASSKRLTDEDTKILEAVRRELSRENRNGDAPGHSHQIPGIWDSDNGDRAGKPCAWCLTWKKFTAFIDREAKLKEFNNGISQ